MREDLQTAAGFDSMLASTDRPLPLLAATYPVHVSHDLHSHSIATQPPSPHAGVGGSVRLQRTHVLGGLHERQRRWRAASSLRPTTWTIPPSRTRPGTVAPMLETWCFMIRPATYSGSMCPPALARTSVPPTVSTGRACKSASGRCALRMVQCQRTDARQPAVLGSCLCDVRVKVDRVCEENDVVGACGAQHSSHEVPCITCTQGCPGCHTHRARAAPRARAACLAGPCGVPRSPWGARWSHW